MTHIYKGTKVSWFHVEYGKTQRAGLPGFSVALLHEERSAHSASEAAADAIRAQYGAHLYVVRMTGTPGLDGTFQGFHNGQPVGDIVTVTAK